MKIAITGHRPKRLLGKEKEIEEWIKKQLTKNNYSEAYSGMATGTDQIFAKVAEEYNIPLICCYPYHLRTFHPEQKNINDKAKEVKFISEEYSKKAYWIRDKYMVDNCDVLLAVFDGVKEGGTWITIQYADKIGRRIIYFPFNNEEKESNNE